MAKLFVNNVEYDLPPELENWIFCSYYPLDAQFPDLSPEERRTSYFMVPRGHPSTFHETLWDTVQEAIDDALRQVNSVNRG